MAEASTRWGGGERMRRQAWGHLAVQLPSLQGVGGLLRAPLCQGRRHGCLDQIDQCYPPSCPAPPPQVVVPLSGEGGRAGHLHLGLLMEKEAQPGEAIGEPAAGAACCLDGMPGVGWPQEHTCRRGGSPGPVPIAP